MNIKSDNVFLDTKRDVIQIKNLSVKIKLDEGLLTPVRGVSFSIKESETLGLVGESGCGKSLTSKSILGINSENCIRTGEILFTDVDGKTTDLMKYKRQSKELRNIRGKRISMIFQEPMTSFSPLFTVGSQVAEVVRLHITKNKKEAKSIAIKMMDRVGITDPGKRFDQYPHEFSGGDAAACADSHGPGVQPEAINSR